MAGWLKRTRKRIRHGLRSYRPKERMLRDLLADQRIDLVLDVGANVGDYAGNLADLGYDGEVLLFEPLSAAHARLSARAATHPRWRVMPRGALGERAGRMEINIAGNSFSSSLLPMTATHVAAASSSAYVASEPVEVRTLDELVGPGMVAGRRAFLKLDVQGYEAKVIDGAAATLPLLAAIQLELSVRPLYDGQPDYVQLLGRLAAAGFRLHQIYDSWCDERGSLLQFDALLVKAEGPAR